jgi:hypothetical protein
MSTPSIVLMAAAAATAFFITAPAEANSRFTIDNHTSVRVHLDVFNGDDPSCVIQAKDKQAKAGEEKGIGCAGGGKQRCKVQLFWMTNQGWKAICKDMYDGCKGESMILDNNARLTVTETDDGGAHCNIK